MNTTETNWIAEIGEVPPAATTIPPTIKAEGDHLKEPEDLGTSPANTLTEETQPASQTNIEEPPPT